MYTEKNQNSQNFRGECFVTTTFIVCLKQVDLQLLFFLLLKLRDALILTSSLSI